MRYILLATGVLFFFRLDAQINQNVGFGVGNGLNQNLDSGTTIYATYSRQIAERFGISSRINNTFVTQRVYSDGNISDHVRSNTFTVQQQLDWFVIKRALLFYPSFGWAAGKEWFKNPSGIDRDRWLWGLNTSFNLEIPIKRFLVGGRLSGELYLERDTGIYIIGRYLTIKYRLGKH